MPLMKQANKEDDVRRSYEQLYQEGLGVAGEYMQDIKSEEYELPLEYPEQVEGEQTFVF